MRHACGRRVYANSMAIGCRHTNAAKMYSGLWPAWLVYAGAGHPMAFPRLHINGEFEKREGICQKVSQITRRPRSSWKSGRERRHPESACCGLPLAPAPWGWPWRIDHLLRRPPPAWGRPKSRLRGAPPLGQLPGQTPQVSASARGGCSRRRRLPAVTA